MKKYKKLICLCLALMQLFAFVGCVKHENFADGEKTDEASEEAPERDYCRIDGKDLFGGVDGIKEGDFILLKVSVVGEGESLAHGEQSVQGGGETGGLAPGEFADIGILFLGHEAGTGAESIVKLDEVELLTAPEDEVL